MASTAKDSKLSQVIGSKDSFYWAKLCLSRLPVLPEIGHFGARRLDVQMYLGTSG